MKRLITFSTIAVLSLSGCSNDKYVHLIKQEGANVILITGQSNASGNSPWEFLEKNDSEVYQKFKEGTNNVLTSYWVNSSNYNSYFEPTKFGMADSQSLFGPEIGIADVFSSLKENTYIIKFAIGGSRLDNEWLDSKGNRGRYYKDSINWFKKKINYLISQGVKPQIIGQFWMQGEADSVDPCTSKYESNITSLISYYRSDLKSYDMKDYKFVDAYISTKTIWPDPIAINQAKQNVADKDPYVYCIKTNGEDENSIDLNIKKDSNEGDDAAHYDSLSEVLLGQTVGKIFLENIK